MFRNTKFQRTIAGVVLTTFMSLSGYPLTAAAQAKDAIEKAGLLPKQKDEGFIGNAQRYINKLAGDNKTAGPGSDEQLGQLLAEIHEQLKVVVPDVALPKKTQHGAGGRATLPDNEIDDRVKSIRAKSAKIKGLYADIDQSFKDTAKRLKDAKLAQVILDRHNATVSQYQSRKAEFERLTSLIEKTADNGNRPDLQIALNALGSFMAKYRNAKPHQYIDPNKLPFGTRDGKVRKPFETPAEYQTALFPVKYRDMMLAGPIPDGLQLVRDTLPQTPNPADLAETEDVQITQAIKDKVEELQRSPVKIYNWVRNNIEFIPTFGSIQGSDITFQSLRGNAFDTSSLLIAMYRAAGIPARYSYGTIEVPIDRAMNWIGGVTNPAAAQSLLGQGGIPNVGITSGGVIKTIRMEHVWVSAYVDYFPSRGALNKKPNTWISIDPSYKQYSTTPALLPADFASEIKSAAAGYLQSASVSAGGAAQTGFDIKLFDVPLQNAQAKMSSLLAANPDKFTLEEVIGGRGITTYEPSTLAGTLPYKLITVGSQFSAVPATFRVAATVELYSTDASGEASTMLFGKPISLPALKYASLNLTHIPATRQDADVWDTYTKSGAKSFPAYMVNVKSQLKLDGATIAESAGLRMGSDLVLKVSFDGAGFNKTAEFRIIAGDEMEIGINGAGQSPWLGLMLKDRTDLGTAAGNLYATAKVYWTQQDFQDRLLGSLHGVATTRLPSVGIFSAPMSVTYNFGVPSVASYHSRGVDIKLSNIAAVALDGNAQTTATFMLNSGIYGSNTEGNVIEEVFTKPIGRGSNTVRLLQLADEQKIPIFHLTATNFDANRTLLQHAPEVMDDLSNALNAGLEVVIPQTRQTHGTWEGSGYIIIDPITGSADYRISGGLSGNITDEACQKQSVPIKAALPDISFFWWVALGWMVDDDFNLNGVGVIESIAHVAAITAIGIVGGSLLGAIGGAAAGLTRVGIAGFAAALSLPVEGANSVDDCSCVATQLGYRKGGISGYTTKHNVCADQPAYTDFPGTDIMLRGVAFDGWTLVAPPFTLSEIKTGKFYSVIKGFENTRPSIKKFRIVLLAKALAGFYRERIPSAFCGVEYRYAALDSVLLGDMKQFFGQYGDPTDAKRLENAFCP